MIRVFGFLHVIESLKLIYTPWKSNIFFFILVTTALHLFQNLSKHVERELRKKMQEVQDKYKRDIQDMADIEVEEFGIIYMYIYIMYFHPKLVQWKYFKIVFVHKYLRMLT